MVWWVISVASARDGFVPTSVDRVAMISFHVTNLIALPNTEGAVGSVKAIGDVVGPRDAAEEEAAAALAEANAARAYDAVRDAYAAAFGWTLPTREEVTSSAAVARAVTLHPERFNPFEDRARVLNVTGLLSDSGWDGMTLAERDALLDALGVDAVVLSAVSASGEPGSVSLFGFGHAWLKPESALYTTVYVRGDEHATWRRAFLGPKAELTVKSTLGKVEDTTPAMFDAIDAGLAKFTAKYQKKFAREPGL